MKLLLLALITFSTAIAQSQQNDITQLDYSVSEAYDALNGEKQFGVNRQYYSLGEKTLIVKKTKKELYIQHLDNSDFSVSFVSEPIGSPYNEYEGAGIVKVDDKLFYICHTPLERIAGGSLTLTHYACEISTGGKQFVGSPKAIDGLLNIRNLRISSDAKFIASITGLSQNEKGGNNTVLTFFDKQFNVIDKYEIPDNSRIKDIAIKGDHAYILEDIYSVSNEKGIIGTQISINLRKYNPVTKSAVVKELEVPNIGGFHAIGKLVLAEDYIDLVGIASVKSSPMPREEFWATSSEAITMPNEAYFLRFDYEGKMIDEEHFCFDKRFKELNNLQKKSALSDLYLRKVSVHQNIYTLMLEGVNSGPNSMGMINTLPFGNVILAQFEVGNDEMSYHIAKRSQWPGIQLDEAETGTFFYSTNNYTYAFYIDNEKNLEIPEDKSPSVYKGVNSYSGHLLGLRISHDDNSIDRIHVFDKKDCDDEKVYMFKVSRVLEIEPGKLGIELNLQQSKKELVFVTINLD